MASSLSAIAASTTCGIFTLGMVIPWANSYGAIVGGVAGVIASGLVAFGSQFVSASKQVVAHKLPVFVNESCFDKYGIDPNITIPEVSIFSGITFHFISCYFQTFYPDESSIFPLFRLSFLWITPVGVCTVLVVGVAVSFLTGKTNLSYLDPELISPVAQWILPKEAQRCAGSAIRKARHRELVEKEKMVPDVHVLATSSMVRFEN